jgi:hypothetical protein
MPPPMRLSRDFLIRGITYKLQERAYWALAASPLSWAKAVGQGPPQLLNCGRRGRRDWPEYPGEIPSNASAWAASRVGDKLERNPRRLNPRNRVEGARQERVAHINDALEVEQYAADGAAKPLPSCIDLIQLRLTECSETAVLHIPRGSNPSPTSISARFPYSDVGLSCANSPGPVADDPVPIARRVA